MNSKDEFLRNLAYGIDTLLPEIYGQKMGFALIIFPFNHPSADYVSNADRSNMIEALRETADRIESGAVIGVPQGTA